VLLEEVQSGRQRLQSLTRQLIDSQEQERRHLARELHDEIGQVLTAVKTNLQSLQFAADPKTLPTRLEESIRIVERALGQTSDLSLDLRPSLLDDFGLVPALEWYVRRQAQRSGFLVTFIAHPEEMRLPPNLETTCFRVAQAAVTNIARHAQAGHVRIELDREGAELRLLVRDDGIGFDVPAALGRTAPNESFGLLAMQERVALVGGQIDLSSAPGCGTEVHVRLPLDPSHPLMDRRTPERNTL
jgi:signal transduction histidine kinase